MTSRPDPKCQDVVKCQRVLECQDVLADPHRSPRKPSVPRVRRRAARTRRILTLSWDRNFGIFETKGKRVNEPGGIFARSLDDPTAILDDPWHHRLVPNPAGFPRIPKSLINCSLASRLTSSRWRDAFDRSDFRRLSGDPVRRGRAVVRQPAVRDPRITDCSCFII